MSRLSFHLSAHFFKDSSIFGSIFPLGTIIYNRITRITGVCVLALPFLKPNRRHTGVTVRLRQWVQRKRDLSQSGFGGHPEREQ